MAAPCCLILDVSLPDLSRLVLQRQIASERKEMPIIFLSSHRDFETTLNATKAGALDFLTKPVDAESVLNAIGEAD